MVLLGCQFMYSVDIQRRDPMIFINRQINGFAVKLARAGENQLDVRIEMPAGFQQSQLGRAIILQVLLRTKHRIDVADTTGEVKDIINAADDMIDELAVPDVPDVYIDPALD